MPYGCRNYALMYAPHRCAQDIMAAEDSFLTLLLPEADKLSYGRLEHHMTHWLQQTVTAAGPSVSIRRVHSQHNKRMPAKTIKLKSAEREQCLTRRYEGPKCQPTGEIKPRVISGSSGIQGPSWRLRAPIMCARVLNTFNG